MPPLFFNGVEVKNLFWNGTELNEGWFNEEKVFTKGGPSVMVIGNGLSGNTAWGFSDGAYGSLEPKEMFNPDFGPNGVELYFGLFQYDHSSNTSQRNTALIVAGSPQIKFINMTVTELISGVSRTATSSEGGKYAPVIIFSGDPWSLRNNAGQTRIFQFTVNSITFL